jgi:cyanate lyase
MSESAVLLHVWEVRPEHHADLLDRLASLFRAVHSDPGFVSARVLETEDHGSVAAILEMRSVEDRQRIQARPDVRETLEHVQPAFNLLYRLYHEVAVYSA